MRYQTRIEAPRFGVCSTYLASLAPHPSGAAAAEGNGAAAGARVAVWLRPSELRLPASDAAPILMVGPGTGVAPFRAFVQERGARRSRGGGGGGGGDGGGVGDAVLYFGCRGAASDFLYAHEWEGHLTRGALQAFHTAFSRDGPAKVYVQHRMAEPPNAAAVWEVLRHDEGHVYIAGASKQMPKDVREALARAAVDHGGLDKAAAEALLKRLEVQRRLQCETW